MRWALAITLFALVAWRVVWLSAGVRDVTAEADRVRAMVLDEIRGNANAYLVTFVNAADTGSPPSWHVGEEEVWDSELPIWITPGADGMPGWAGWDDNRNGEIDEANELGAAWSDDFCVVEMDHQTSAPNGRVLDRGGFRKTKKGEQPDRIRYTWK